MVIIGYMDTKGVKVMIDPLDLLNIQSSDEGAFTILVPFRSSLSQVVSLIKVLLWE